MRETGLSLVVVETAGRQWKSAGFRDNRDRRNGTDTYTCLATRSKAQLADRQSLSVAIASTADREWETFPPASATLKQKRKENNKNNNNKIAEKKDLKSKNEFYLLSYCLLHSLPTVTAARSFGCPLDSNELDKSEKKKDTLKRL